MNTSTQSIVSVGIRNGWIKFRQHDPMPEKKTQAQFRDEWRKRNLEKGLTVEGKPRRNRTLPELKGLTGLEYHRAYHKVMSERFLAAGLNCHGKKRKRRK